MIVRGKQMYCLLNRHLNHTHYLQQKYQYKHNRMLQQMLQKFSEPTSNSARPALQEWVDWQRARELLDNCTSGHVRCTARRLSPYPPDFRLLDTETLRIIAPTQQKRFAALSYGRGAMANAAGLRIVGSNMMSLEQSCDFQNLPRTFQDAITICRFLNIEYLWIDRLCIIQDDGESKHIQIGSTATVFASALVVIVAATIENCDQPIPGISKPRDTSNFSYSLPPWTKYTGRSIWWTSGWTYQEVILARRKLFFSDTEIWMECDQTVEREVKHSIVKLDKQSQWYYESTSVRETSSDQSQTDIDQFRKHLSLYTLRTLSHESDIYDAFSGVLNSLYSEKGGCLYGMPRADFIDALLWLTHEGPVASKRSLGQYSVPTWSWASRTGQIRSRSQQRLFLGPLIMFFEFVDDGESSRIEPIKSFNPPRSWIAVDKRSQEATHLCSPQGELALALEHGLFTTRPEESQGDLRSASGIKINERADSWTSFSAFYEEVVAIQPQPDFSLLPADLTPIFHPEIILTTCHISRFVVEVVANRYQILDASDLPVGMLYFDPILEERLSYLNGVGCASFSFIGIGISRLTSTDVFRVDEYQRIRSDSLGTEDMKDLVVNVMAIEYVREEYVLAHRVAVGWVAMTAWISSNRTISPLALS